MPVWISIFDLVQRFCKKTALLVRPIAFGAGFCFTADVFSPPENDSTGPYWALPQKI